MYPYNVIFFNTAKNLTYILILTLIVIVKIILDNEMFVMMSIVFCNKIFEKYKKLHF
jgi:hypothetical protein